MKQRTKELLDQIEAKHDWSRGQTYAAGGDEYTYSDKCRICGLVRDWSSGSRQNGIGAFTTFQDSHGNVITLRDASALDC